MASSAKIMTYSQYKNNLASKEKLHQSKDESNRTSKQAKKPEQKGIGKTVTVEVPEPDCEYEQHISIIQNPRPRRGSMANFAFPELHPKAKLKAEPENLLLLTRTKTDSHGRRHSVSIPLIPPPDGEKFEGGYHIERNPINGAARLVHPSKEKSGKKISRSSSARSAEKKASLSTIEESAISVCDTKKRATETGAIPKTGRGRRHSMQVSTLNKDMEKLKMTLPKDGEEEKRLPGAEMSNQRKKELSRANSKKKSNKQGFLHFLDHAIAN